MIGVYFFIQLKKMIWEIKEKCDKMRIEIEKDRKFQERRADDRKRKNDSRNDLLNSARTLATLVVR